MDLHNPEDALLLVNAAAALVVLVITCRQLPRLNRLGSGRWTLWAGCSLLVVSVLIGSVGKWFDWNPLIWRPLVLTGLILIGVGYERDGREFRAGTDRL